VAQAHGGAGYVRAISDDGRTTGGGYFDGLIDGKLAQVPMVWHWS
jgi:hypothetical protein